MGKAFFAVSCFMVSTATSSGNFESLDADQDGFLDVTELLPLVYALPMTQTWTEDASICEAPDKSINVSKGLVATFLDDFSVHQGPVLDQFKASRGPNETIALPGGGHAFMGYLNSLGTRTSLLADGSINVTLPQALFDYARGLPPPVAGDELVFTAAALSEETSSYLGALRAVVLDLKWLFGLDAQVKGLAKPVTFSIPIVYNESITCGFWDEKAEEWTTAGVAVSEQSVPGGILYCETTHFSLFGAIWKGVLATLLCANFDLLRGEAVRQIWLGEWPASKSAMLLYALLACLVAMFGGAVFIDHLRERRFHWRNEFFLVLTATTDAPAPGASSGTDEAAGEEDGDASGREDRVEAKEPAAPVRAFSALGAFMSWLCGSGACREALDDILESWLGAFAFARSAVEEVCGGIVEECAKPSCQDLIDLSHRITSKLLVFVSRRATAVTLGMSEEMINFVLEEEELGSYLTDERHRRSRTEAERGTSSGSVRTGGDRWRGAHDQFTAWSELHKEVCEVVHRHANTKHSKAQLCLAICRTVLIQNPIGELFVLDIFQSAKQKAAMLATELLGTLAFVCAFFQGSGMVAGKALGDDELCSLDESTLGFRIGRFVVITVASLLIAAFPVTIMESLKTKGFKTVTGAEARECQLRAWAIQERLFWTVAFVYNGFCMFYVTIFVANISPAGHEDFFVGGVLSLFEDFMAMPLLMAMAFPLLSRGWLLAHCRLTKQDYSAVVRKVCEEMHNSSNMMLPLESV